MKTTIKVGQTGDAANVGMRDAFHVPCVLVTSDMKTFGGSPVKFLNDSKVAPCETASSHGVVDPFLGQVLPGQAFWVFVKPALVDNLVHSFEVRGVIENVDLVKQNEVLLKQLDQLKANFQAAFDNKENEYQAQLIAFQEKYDNLQDTKAEELYEPYDADEDSCRGCYN